MSGGDVSKVEKQWETMSSPVEYQGKTGPWVSDVVYGLWSMNVDLG
jgi:hypothetical protein